MIDAINAQDPETAKARKALGPPAVFVDQDVDKDVDDYLKSKGT